jgi:hypothetical protein
MNRIQRIIDLKTDSDSNIETFNIAYFGFKKYIEETYTSWFPKCKEYNDIDITNQITRKHIKTEDYKTYIKYQLNVILKSSQRICDNINRFNTEKPEYVHKEIELLSEYGVDCMFFLTWAFKVIEKKNLKCEIGKPTAIEPNNIVSASRLILRNHIDDNHPGSKVIRYSSIFLIRQSIEVFIKNLFGISYITNSQGEIQRLQPEKLLDLIDDNKNTNSFPLPKSVLKNIHSWTQTYVHGGFLPYVWEIEWMNFMIEPIFNFERIRLKKGFVDSIPNIIKSIYNNEDLVIYGENIWKYGFIEE